MLLIGPYSFVHLLKDIYSNSLLGIKLPLGMTSTFSSKVVLKQGCNQSPILYINDFIDEIIVPVEGTLICKELFL